LSHRAPSPPRAKTFEIEAQPRFFDFPRLVQSFITPFRRAESSASELDITPASTPQFSPQSFITPKRESSGSESETRTTGFRPFPQTILPKKRAPNRSKAEIAQAEAEKEARRIAKAEAKTKKVTPVPFTIPTPPRIPTPSRARTFGIEAQPSFYDLPQFSSQSFITPKRESSGSESDYPGSLSSQMKSSPQTVLPKKRAPNRSKAEIAQAEAEKEARRIAKAEAKTKKGKGFEKLIDFGAIKISPSQLRLYDILRVREPSKHSITGLPDMRVSKDMVFILSKIMNGQSPSATELKALSPKEQTIYDAVIFKAKLHTHVPHNADVSISELKRRLILLEGEVEAGNTNKEIKKELNHVIRQLVELKAISLNNARNYLKQI